LVLSIGLLLWQTAWAGIKIEVTDPRYFESEHRVIFPHAEVKLVTFEFTSVQQDERGKQRAKELHDQFLAKIHDLQGGAIITYVTPPGQRIENYRVHAEQVAKAQNAQMALWGNIFVDTDGTSYINARLVLIEPPPGISSELEGFSSNSSVRRPLGIRGLIEAPVMETRIDFNAYENDVRPLVQFLSGLARYYKGAVRERENAKRWLNGAIDDLSEYIEQVPERVDRSSLAQAHLYLSRCYFRLARVASSGSRRFLEAARQQAADAARLNPYAASIPATQAVISAYSRESQEKTDAYLRQSIRLAPTNSNIRMNSAVFDAVHGRLDHSIRQLDDAVKIQKLLKQEPSQAPQALRKELGEFQRPAARE
jgi:tetratricopeptide (TPR) repeat protein